MKPLWSRRVLKTKSAIQDASDLHGLRGALKDSLANIGILSAFLCTLGCSAYVEPPSPPGNCLGEGTRRGIRGT